MNNSKRSIWKKIAITSIGSGASQVINFIFGIVLVRLLSVSEYSVYKQGNLILTTCMSFFFIISPISLGYFMGKYKDRAVRKIYLMQTVYSLLLVSAVGSVLLYLLREQIGGAFTNPLLVDYFGLTCLIIFMETGCSYYTYYMVAENKNRKLAYVTFFSSLLRVIALGLSLLFKKHLFTAFMILYVLSVAIKFFYMLYDTYKDYKGISYEINTVSFKSQLYFSIPFMIMSIITALNNNMDKNIVSLLYSPEEYSIYVNGAFEIPFISVISTSIITVMLPEISSKFDPENKKALQEIVFSFRKIISVSCSIMIPIVFSVLLFSREIVVILFSSKYIACLTLFRIYLFMLVFKALNLSVLITAADKQYHLVKNGIVMIMSNIVLILMIQHTLGFDYMTLGPLLATLVMNILMLLDIKKIYQCPNSFSVLPLKELVWDIFVCLVIMLLMEPVVILLPGSLLKTVLLGPVTYVAMFLCCLFFNKDAKQFIVQKLKKGAVSHEDI